MIRDSKKALNNYKIEELDVSFLLEFVDQSQMISNLSDMPSEDFNAHNGMEDHNSSSAMMFMKHSSKVEAR